MSTQPRPFLTPEEYLEIERKAEFKSEYYQGEMFAMAGTSENHNVIIHNLNGLLFPQLRERPCRVYTADMRVHVGRFYTYPDIAVVCGERKFSDAKFDTLINPAVICEVLSPSTEVYDRGRKFRFYQAIGSLQHYVLVSTELMLVEIFTRQQDGTWNLASMSLPEDVVDLKSIDCRLKLAEIYEKVEFPA